GLAGVVHADGAGFLCALRVVAALAADVVDAHFTMAPAVVVVAALRIRRRLGTTEEQHQGEGGELSHVRALTTVRTTVKQACAAAGREAARASPPGAALSARARAAGPPSGRDDARNGRGRAARAPAYTSRLSQRDARPASPPHRSSHRRTRCRHHSAASRRTN